MQLKQLHSVTEMIAQFYLRHFVSLKNVLGTNKGHLFTLTSHPPICSNFWNRSAVGEPSIK